MNSPDLLPRATHSVDAPVLQRTILNERPSVTSIIAFSFLGFVSFRITPSSFYAFSRNFTRSPLFLSVVLHLFFICITHYLSGSSSERRNWHKTTCPNKQKRKPWFTLYSLREFPFLSQEAQIQSGVWRTPICKNRRICKKEQKNETW